MEERRKEKNLQVCKLARAPPSSVSGKKKNEKNKGLNLIKFSIPKLFLGNSELPGLFSIFFLPDTEEGGALAKWFLVSFLFLFLNKETNKLS